jgi:hypothetical protein
MLANETTVDAKTIADPKVTTNHGRKRVASRARTSLFDILFSCGRAAGECLFRESEDALSVNR